MPYCVFLLQRQRSKRDLANLVAGSDDLNTGGTDEATLGALGALGAEGRKNGGEKRMSLTRKDVLQLLYPALCPQQVDAPTSVTRDALEPSAAMLTSSGGGARQDRKRGRIHCSDDEGSVESDSAPAGELKLADVLDTPSSCETYAEDPAGEDDAVAMLDADGSASACDGAAEGVDGQEWVQDSVKCEVVEKASTDEVLLATMSQLGATVISKAACVE